MTSNNDDAVESAMMEFHELWTVENPPDVEVFCRRFPGIEDALRERIEEFLFVAGGLRDAEQGPEDAPSKGFDGQEVPSGQVLGDFTILREIGRGGMGVVYEAEQRSLHRSVALKILPSHLSFSTDAVKKFEREAEAGGRQQHHGIVAVHAIGEHEGVHFIAQELVGSGVSLADQLDRLREEGEQPPGYFREVAQLVAEVAEAMQQAHESGVIHRDMKPSNILMTEEGQPKVTDFGLAKIEDAIALSRTGDFAGTPYYMSPEQAMSRRMGIDKRTDIYSLGVTLYEMLTLCRPFEGDSSQEVLKMIMVKEPSDPHRVNPRVPRDLSVIALKAMEKDPDRRYQSMEAFLDDLNRFLQGDVILAKPAGLQTRMLKRIKRNPVVSASMGIALIALLGFGIVLPWVIATKERELRESEEKARTEIERLSDVKRLADLEREADHLWPQHPEKIGAIEDWLDRTRDLLGRRKLHQETLVRLREQALTGEEEWAFESLETQWRHDTLMGLVSGLSGLDAPGGLHSDMEKRLEEARSIRKRSIDDHQVAWTQAVAAIQVGYKRLTIEPIVGLVPIGKDPASGFLEFVHLQSGAIPERGTDGNLMLTEETGLVFVLIPQGSFNMGAMRSSATNPVGAPNVDPDAHEDEGPVHRVTIKPFLMSKYEMTQGQWLRLTGSNPSDQGPDTNLGGKQYNLMHPVEQVDWDDCRLWLNRYNLRLPSESEWEYAARAFTTTTWWTGNEKESMNGAANLCDLSLKNNGGPEDWPYEEWLDDGYLTHAPVGIYKPNPFGLHNVIGNVMEWCQDNWMHYTDAPTDGSAAEVPNSPVRTYRGGCWADTAEASRSARRHDITPDTRVRNLGVRPACSILTR